MTLAELQAQLDASATTTTTSGPTGRWTAGSPPTPMPPDPKPCRTCPVIAAHHRVRTHIYNVTMIAPDVRGLLSKAAGVLALNSLRVHSASVNGHEGSAISTFVGRRISVRLRPPKLLRQQFILEIEGELDVMASLDKRDGDAAHHGTRRAGKHM